MLVRTATLEDAEAIRAIYNREVLESTVTFDLVPRTLAEQQDWQRARAGAMTVIVAELDGVVAGFGALSAYRDRPGYRTSVENSVYVDPAHRGRGLGDALVERLLVDARAHGFHAVFARIVGGHHASIALHRKHGFRVVGTEREVGRKFGQWLDVVLMECLVGDHDRRRPSPPPARHPALDFVDAVNLRSADDRRDRLERILAPEFRYCEPTVAELVRGIGEMDQLISARLARRPHLELVAVGSPETHHDVWRLRWRLHGDPGPTGGLFTGELDPTGRILRIDCFVDAPEGASPHAVDAPEGASPHAVDAPEGASTPDG
jgi:L-amino acid N-acyltransferase